MIGIPYPDNISNLSEKEMDHVAWLNICKDIYLMIAADHYVPGISDMVLITLNEKIKEDKSDTKFQTLFVIDQLTKVI